MPRLLLLVALLVALFSLTVAVRPSFIAEESTAVEQLSVAAPSASCPNSCSSHGMCSTASTCVCDAGYLGMDCSVQSAMKPMCWLKGELCSYWAIQGAYLYQRVTTTMSSGAAWAAVMWGATDGMSNGQAVILNVANPFTAFAFDTYNMKKGRPNTTATQSIAAGNVSGTTTAPGALDISFVRLLDTGLDQHYVIPAKSGQQTNVSFAYGEQYFQFHGPNATMVKIDIAAAAQGLVEQTEEPTGLTKLWNIIQKHM